jgi:hypothetical protein
VGPHPSGPTLPCSSGHAPKWCAGATAACTHRPWAPCWPTIAPGPLLNYRCVASPRRPILHLRVPFKMGTARCRPLFSFPPPFCSLLEQDRAPPSPLPPVNHGHRRRRHSTRKSKLPPPLQPPHGELPPLAIVVLRHRPLLTPCPTLVLQDPPKLATDH